MKRERLVATLSCLGLLCLLVPTSLGQTAVQAVQPVSANRQSLAITYPENLEIKVEFKGTYRLPMASGEAEVEREKGSTKIEITLHDVKPAHLFGGNYSTYVLWTVSPEGIADNIGEFILESDHSKLKVSTPLETFGMCVTAEPHFLVSSPSRFVVLENTRPTREISGSMLRISEIQYHGFEGIYNYDRETLSNAAKIDAEVRPDLREAGAAVNLAIEARAETYARPELEKARAAFETTKEAVARNMDLKQVMLLGHEAVRLAVAAQKLAEQRAFQAALDAEHKAHSDELARSEQAVASAQTEAERARLQAEQRELQLNMERRARESLQQQRELARRTETGSREQGHAQLRQQLNQFGETRESSNTVTVILPDTFFDQRSAVIQPHGREVLSRLAGMLNTRKGYRLRIEGHSDTTGDVANDLKLSSDRADSVRQYLIAQGIPAGITTVQGLGSAEPLAPNDTAEGRLKNRRIEIVVEEMP